MTDDPVLRVLHQVTKAAPAARKRPRAAPPFAAKGELPLAALTVEVEGVGALSPALSDEQAQTLHAASTPAPHGQRERTVLDTRVRHTGEIAAQQVALHWAAGAFDALQAQAAQGLGLDRVEARLHSLLVYGPGQFFKPHQDTEKHPGMVASLVLVWPSAHIGGELHIRQADALQTFASQHLRAQALSWCAFYADCRHEVKPVEEGWRVVLTFDLVLPSDAAEVPDVAHPALVRALRDLFFPGGSDRREPWLLLLDHEYSERGLRWSLLKSDDRPRVAALRAAAVALGLVPQLALAEIHQNWTAYVPYQGRGRSSGGEPERDELIDEQLSLDFWVDTEGRTHKGQAFSVAPADCASFTEAHDDFLVNEEYEGYMGNYGETLDCWYRRAALVLQSPTAAEASRFATQPEAALVDALKLARQPAQHAALARLILLAKPDLVRYARSKGRSVLACYAQLAAALPPDLASELCAPFEWQHLLPADARCLAVLGRVQGWPWLMGLLRSWTQALAPRASWGWSSCGYAALADDAGAVAAGLWPKPLTAFVDACLLAQWPPEMLHEVMTQALSLQKLADASKATPVQRLAAWPTRLQAICELAQAAQRLPQKPAPSGPLQALLQHVAAQPQLYPARELVPLLQALTLPAALAACDGQALLGRVRAALQSALEAPLPPADDHGLRDMPWTCVCADCKPALHWAESPSSQPLLLAMAESRRHHVQTALQDAAAPLMFATLKQGSPHKLVLTKPTNLHVERQRLRAVWAANLTALDGVVGRG